MNLHWELSVLPLSRAAHARRRRCCCRGRQREGFGEGGHTKDEFLSGREHVEGEGHFVLVALALEPAEEGGGEHGLLAGDGCCVRREFLAPWFCSAMVEDNKWPDAKGEIWKFGRLHGLDPGPLTPTTEHCLWPPTSCQHPECRSSEGYYWRFSHCSLHAIAFGLSIAAATVRPRMYSVQSPAPYRMRRKCSCALPFAPYADQGMVPRRRLTGLFVPQQP